MRAVLFACLLALAGVSAMPPQEVEAPLPTQDRFMDLWVQDFIQNAIQTIIIRGYDPLKKEFYQFGTHIIPGLLYVEGYVKNLKCVGLSSLDLKEVKYNILLGRLDMILVLKGVELEIEQYVATGRYGSRGGQGELSGSLVLSELSLTVDTLLSVFPGAPVQIFNINCDLRLGSIQADFTAGWKCLGCLTPRDVSSCVNNFINVGMLELVETYRAEMNTLIGEGIRVIVNNWWF